MCIPARKQSVTKCASDKAVIATTSQSANLTALVNRVGGVDPLGHLYLCLSFPELLKASRVTRNDYAAWGPAVRFLELKGVKIFFEDLQKLVNRTPRLQQLVLRPAPTISGYGGLDANTLQLARSPLKSLTIQNQQISPQLLNQLSPDSLTHLHVMDSDLSLPPTSSVLARFLHLKNFTLENCCLNGETLKQIATIRSLERLVLSCCHLSEEWRDNRILTIKTLPDFTALPALVELDITGSQIDLAGFIKMLQQLPNLRVFIYNDCYAINTAYLEQLATNCPHLEVLDVTGCGYITDEALKPLSQLSCLKSLDLTGIAQISDVGLAHLATLRPLENLILTECMNLTADGIRQFEKIRSELGFPPVKIDSRLAH
jgi:hypothetical protein